MHRVPYCEDEDAPCNAYCDGVLHADVAYCREAWAVLTPEELLRQLQHSAVCAAYAFEICGVKVLTEAPAKETKYPQNVAQMPDATLPVRIMYRVLAPEGTRL